MEWTRRDDSCLPTDEKLIHSRTAATTNGSSIPHDDPWQLGSLLLVSSWCLQGELRRVPAISGKAESFSGYGWVWMHWWVPPASFPKPPFDILCRFWMKIMNLGALWGVCRDDRDSHLPISFRSHQSGHTTCAEHLRIVETPETVAPWPNSRLGSPAVTDQTSSKDSRYLTSALMTRVRVKPLLGSRMAKQLPVQGGVYNLLCTRGSTHDFANPTSSEPILRTKNHHVGMILPFPTIDLHDVYSWVQEPN